MIINGRFINVVCAGRDEDGPWVTDSMSTDDADKIRISESDYVMVRAAGDLRSQPSSSDVGNLWPYNYFERNRR